MWLIEYLTCRLYILQDEKTLSILGRFGVKIEASQLTSHVLIRLRLTIGTIPCVTSRTTSHLCNINNFTRYRDLSLGSTSVS